METNHFFRTVANFQNKEILQQIETDVEFNPYRKIWGIVIHFTDGSSVATINILPNELPGFEVPEFYYMEK